MTAAIAAVIIGLAVWAACARAGLADEQSESIMADMTRRKTHEDALEPVEVSDPAERAGGQGRVTGSADGVQRMPGPAEIHGTLGKKGYGMNTERRAYMLPAWLAFVIWAFVVGGFCGWMARMHTVHDQYLTTMAQRYQAEKAWMDARTAEMLAEVERYATDVKRQLKTKRAALR